MLSCPLNLLPTAATLGWCDSLPQEFRTFSRRIVVELGPITQLMNEEPRFIEFYRQLQSASP